MVDFVKTIPLKDLPEGKIKRVMAGKTPVLLINKSGKVYSYQSECTHEKMSLEEGRLEGNQLVCSFHEARFDITSGKVDPDTDFATDLKKYETKIEDGMIFVKV